MECCRCHDHKYDPISARDYYAIGSFFNSIAERGVYSHQKITPGPALMLPTPDQEAQIRDAESAVSAAQAALPQMTAPPDRVAREKLQTARQKLVDIESKVQTVAVMDETPTPRPT